MVCYSIVLGAAIVVHGLKNKMQSRLPHTIVLSILLWGGAIALVVDHLMNGELFLISENVLWDLLVGIGMTTAIFAIWGLYVIISKSLKKEHRYGV